MCQLRESMGIAADGSNKAFPSADVDGFLTRKRVAIPIDIMETFSRNNTHHFVLAVDPSGGGGSAFAVASMVQIPSGQIIVRFRYPHPPHFPHYLAPPRSTPAASFPAALPSTFPTKYTPAQQTNPASGTSYARIVGK